MMNEIKNYAAEVVEALKKITEGYTFEIKEVEKSGTILCGILCRMEGSNVAPTIYVDGAFENGIYPESAAERYRKVLEESAEQAKSIEAITDSFSNFAAIKGNLKVSLLPDNSYSNDLAHKKVADLNKVVYVKVETPQGAGKIAVKPEHLRVWGITEDELFAAAEANHEKVCIKSFYGFMQVASNEEMVDGASVILEPEFNEKAMELFPGGYYILPSSRHEVILVDSSADLDMLKAMVREVNETTVSPEDQLSDNVYELLDGKLVTVTDMAA